MLNRRSFLSTVGGLSAAWMSGCTPGSDQRGTKRALRVFVYAGGHERTMRDVFVPRFAQVTGQTATLYSGWWDAIAKLKSAPVGNPPFDLMITDATQGYPAAREGLFAPLRFENIPNHRLMIPAALDNWVYRDKLGLPYPDAVMTLAYDRRQKGPPPSRWSDLLKAPWQGQIGLYSSFYMSLYTFAAMLADTQGQAGTAQKLLREQPDEVFKFALDRRSSVKLWWPTTNDMILSLHDQGVRAGNMHSPEYLQALREKPILGAVVPEQDRAMVQVFWAIPAGSPQQDLAEQALDLMFSVDMQIEFARRGMATAVPAAAAKIASEDALWKSFYPHTPEQLETLQYYPYDFYAEHWNDLADRWERTILQAS